MEEQMQLDEDTREPYRVFQSLGPVGEWETMHCKNELEAKIDDQVVELKRYTKRPIIADDKSLQKHIEGQVKSVFSFKWSCGENMEKGWIITKKSEPYVGVRFGPWTSITATSSDEGPYSFCGRKHGSWKVQRIVPYRGSDEKSPPVDCRIQYDLGRVVMSSDLSVCLQNAVSSVYHGDAVPIILQFLGDEDLIPSVSTRDGYQENADRRMQVRKFLGNEWYQMGFTVDSS
jgi:hypothetical protein